VSLAKKPSTALSHEAEIGVKWKVQRRCCVTHLRTFVPVRGIVVDDRVDRLSLGNVRTTSLRKRMNS